MIEIDPAKTYQKYTELKAIIRFQDCDPLGHLNNAKYLDYFFNAREDQIKKLYNFAPGELFSKYKTGWVIYQHRISYLRPALYGEWVSIVSRIIHLDKNTLLVEFAMTDESHKHLKAFMWSTMKYVNGKTGRPVHHQPEVQQFLEAICVKEANFSDYDSRIREVKKELLAKHKNS